jgi:AraC-like DNA-binding protein
MRVASAPGGRISPPIFPDNGVDLIVNRRDCFASARVGLDPQPVPTAFVVGMTTVPLFCRFSREAEIVGIRFRPGYAAPLLHGALPEITDAQAAVNALDGPLFSRLADAMLAAPDCPAAFASAAAILLCGQKASDAAVVHAAGLIEKAAGNLPIAAAAGVVGLSLRQFERRFTNSVGLTPKTFARITRFQAALRLLRRAAQGPPPDLGELSLDAGYADQSHLCKDFSRFAAMPPAFYLRSLGYQADRNPSMARWPIR